MLDGKRAEWGEEGEGEAGEEHAPSLLASVRCFPSALPTQRAAACWETVAAPPGRIPKPSTWMWGRRGAGAQGGVRDRPVTALSSERGLCSRTVWPSPEDIQGGERGRDGGVSSKLVGAALPLVCSG